MTELYTYVFNAIMLHFAYGIVTGFTVGFIAWAIGFVVYAFIKWVKK